MRLSTCALMLAGALALLSSCSRHNPPPSARQPASSALSAPTTQPMRGVWLATVSHLDWPPVTSLHVEPQAERIRLQQQALTEALDRMKAIGINTVFFQVKPDASALWRSDILPWSDVLTGVTGKDPGYDPLAYMLEQAHRRGIKVHAWLNPYRVAVNSQPNTLNALRQTAGDHPVSVVVSHPDWIRTAGDRQVLDPGIPQVRDWITSIVSELIQRYPIDGVQFDDYFYAETATSPLHDAASWHRYGQGFSDKASWRRNNTLLLIKQVSAAIRAQKPAVEFGVSPAGVWRNQSEDITGSDTRGAAAYDTAYADTRQWVQLGLLDYIAPQLYWPFSRKIVRYDVLFHWWAETVKSSHTRLYPGIALYKVGTEVKAEPEWQIDAGIPELKRQLDLNESLPGVSGTILFREAWLHQPQTRQAVDYLKQRWGHSP